MNQTELESLVAEHRRFPAVLRALTGSLPAVTLRAREAEGRWSPLEILAHLRDEELEDFRPRAQAAAAAAPITRGIDPQGWVLSRAYNTLDAAQVLADFERERAASCAWLASLDVKLLDSFIEHAALGRMRCGDFVAAWRMHDLLHLRQLATALARLESTQLKGWSIAYAGDLERLKA